MLISPLISFIIPAYNSSGFIRRCITSILSSDFTDFEIIVVDDGSEDDTLEILESLATEDERVRVLSKVNEGQGIARNFGLKVAEGKYIAFVDSDDYLSDCYFDRLVPVLYSDKKFDFINFRLDFRSENGEIGHVIPFFNQPYLRDDEIFRKAMLDDMIYSSPCNKVYNKSFLIDNNIEFPSTRKNEDILFSRILSFYSKKCLFINDVLYHAEIRVGSTSRRMSEASVTDTVLIYEYLEKFLLDKNVFDANKIFYDASVKKVFTYLLFLCSIRIEGKSEYIRTLEVFKVSKVISNFYSLSGLGNLKLKNLLLYFFVRFGGLVFIRFFSNHLMKIVKF